VVEQASPHGGGRPWAADACTDWDAASAAPAQTEGGSGQDVSRDIALEIQVRSDIDGHDVPEAVRDFVDTYAGPDRQLALRLA
jgi:hypothetical protein